MSRRTRLAQLEKKRRVPMVTQIIIDGVEEPIKSPQGEELSYAEFTERYPLTEVIRIYVIPCSPKQKGDVAEGRRDGQTD